MLCLIIVHTLYASDFRAGLIFYRVGVKSKNKKTGKDILEWNRETFDPIASLWLIFSFKIAQVIFLYLIELVKWAILLKFIFA